MEFTEQQPDNNVKIICPWSKYHGKTGIITDKSDFIYVQFRDGSKPIQFAPNEVMAFSNTTVLSAN